MRGKDDCIAAFVCWKKVHRSERSIRKSFQACTFLLISLLQSAWTVVGKKIIHFSRGNVFGFHSCSVNGCEFASNGSYAIQILYEQEHLEHNCKLFRNGFEQYIKHIAKYKCLVGRRKRRKVFQDSIYALMSKSIQSPTLSSLQLEDCLIFGVGIESLIDSYSENWKASDVWSSCCSFV